MKTKYFEFFIKTYSSNLSNDLKFLPMLFARKLSSLDKAAFSTLFDCIKTNSILNTNLVFASIYGQFDRINMLTSQYTNDNEVSPAVFSTSVHNNTIGAFSLFNKITNAYTSVSAGKNTISSALCDAVLELKEIENVLFCYADCIDGKKKSLSILLSLNNEENARKFIFYNTHNENFSDNEYSDLLMLLQNNTNSFNSKYYTIKRIYD